MIRAVLFDLDGTLVDNMGIHVEAWLEVARQHGAAVTRDQLLHEWAGKKNEELIPMMLGRAASPEELRRIAHEKETLYREKAARELTELPGTTALLERLKAAGLKLAVATAAPEENRKLVLDGLSLRRFFDAVIGPESAARGKPAPDIFLASAKALSLEPSACLVFEDALNGVRAGVAAGMPVAAVTTSAAAETLRAAGATWTLTDFRTLPRPLDLTLFSRHAN